jgi:hypothetical protein
LVNYEAIRAEMSVVTTKLLKEYLELVSAFFTA